MYENELLDHMKTLPKEESFSIDFTKKNGEERHYDNCHMNMQLVKEGATRKGLSTSENAARRNLLFYVDDEGYKIACVENIKKVVLNGQTWTPDAGFTGV